MRRIRTGFGVKAIYVGLMVALLGATAVRPALAGPSWSQIMKTFKPGWDPNSANVCIRGDISCVEAVVAEMKRRNKPLMDSCDHNAVFSLLYLRTTEEYLRTVKSNPNYFSNTPFVNHEDALFALYYFRAFDNYKAGRMSKVPSAWKIAFESARDGSTTGGGDLLLGVSAHIQRDLPYVLDSIGAPRQPNGKDDHDKVNQILQRVQKTAIEEAARRLDPTIDDTQIQGTTLDDDGFLQIVKNWREEGWQNAVLLSTQREVTTSKIETNATAQATTFATTNRADATAREKRDSWCALHHDDR
ncbi:MAG: hypothetical protein H0W55_03655 [Actinobacteria bacterium]|nr:hypothetical protein [Actinomycetota bacterium]MDQ3532162.1 DUF5995 family protein [Actinomycetota bacterium]